VVLRGGDYGPWDLEVRGGLFGVSRLLMGVEDHKAGSQLLRFRVWPKASVSAFVLILLFAALSVGAGFDQAWVVSGILGGAAMLVGLRTFKKCAGSMNAFLRMLKKVKQGN